jgi:hypothetical protein
LEYVAIRIGQVELRQAVASGVRRRYEETDLT